MAPRTARQPVQPQHQQHKNRRVAKVKNEIWQHGEQLHEKVRRIAPVHHLAVGNQGRKQLIEPRHPFAGQTAESVIIIVHAEGRKQIERQHQQIKQQ